MGKFDKQRVTLLDQRYMPNIISQLTIYYMEICFQQTLSQITQFLHSIFHAIRNISYSQPVGLQTPLESQAHISQIIRSGQFQNFKYYLEVCSTIESTILNLEQEYSKLQNLLQKYETDIRHRVGCEQQLKLYIEAQNSQLQENTKKFRVTTEAYEKQISKLKSENKKLTEELKKSTIHHSISNTFSFQKKSYLNCPNKNNESRRKFRERNKTQNFPSAENANNLTTRLHTVNAEEGKRNVTESGVEAFDLRNKITDKLKRQSNTQIKKKQPKMVYGPYSYHKHFNNKKIENKFFQNKSHSKERSAQGRKQNSHDLAYRKSGRRNPKYQYSVRSVELQEESLNLREKIEGMGPNFDPDHI